MGIKRKTKDKILHKLGIDTLRTNLAIAEARINKLEAENEALKQCQARLDALETILNQEIRPVFKRVDNLENFNNEYTRPRSEQLEKTVNSINEITTGLENKVSNTYSNLEGVSVNLRNNNAAIEGLQSDSEFVKYKLASIEKNAKSVSAPVATSAPATASVSAPATTSADSDYEEIDYFDFENHFRGSIDSIKKAQEAYIPYLKDKKKVLDIGCGRGEFLSLMKDNEINAIGIDIYEPYADYCRMKGLDVTAGDGVSYLSTLDDVDGIFVGQVVEHLKPYQIISLCNTAYEKLTEGGCIIIETPNPTSLSIYTNAFYIDPSHVKPVHPLTMKYYLEKAGFKKIEILYTENSKPDMKIPALKADAENLDEFNDALKKVSDIIFGSQDYAIIATK